MQQRSTGLAEGESLTVRRQVWIAYLLAWIAAFTDAIGFLVLQQLGASFMSGNSMVTGLMLGLGNWSAAFNHGLPILSFVLGVMLGTFVLTLVRHWGLRSPFVAVFSLEGLCLLSFLLLGRSALHGGIIPPSQPVTFYLCTIFLTLAMGLQTSTLKRVGQQGIRTTFVTGILSDWTEAFVQYLSWCFGQMGRQQLRQTLRDSLRQPALRHLLLLSGTWGCYLLGAACGAFLEQHLALSALIFPLSALVILIIFDLLRPFGNYSEM